MNAHDRYLVRPWSGEFESEVVLPVRVRYTVHADGEVELTHVVLAASAGEDGTFPWQQLPLEERRTLLREAEGDAHRSS